MADTTATIEFDELPGKAFVVRLSPIPMRAFLDINRRLAKFAKVDEVESVVTDFAELALVDWTGFDGEPTADNLLGQDFNVLLALISQWSTEVAKVPFPLRVPSGAGGPSKARRASSNRKS